MLKDNELEYEVCGDGEAVLMIHGGLVAGSFLPLMRESALADHYRLIRYHRRGHAGSGPMPASCSIEEQAQHARSLLTHLGVERVHLIGHSYGGTIGLQLALDEPSLIHSLVLLEPALLAVPSGPAVGKVIEQAAEFYATGDTAGAVDRFLSFVWGAGWKSVAGTTVPGGPEQAEKDGATFFEVELAALEKWSFDADRADRISQPILYVIGSESDATLGQDVRFWEEGKQLVRTWLPQTQEALVPGVNHLLQVQNPGLVAKEITEFLLSYPQ